MRAREQQDSPDSKYSKGWRIWNSSGKNYANDQTGCEVQKLSPRNTWSFKRTERNGKSLPWRSFLFLCWPFSNVSGNKGIQEAESRWMPLALGIQDRPRPRAQGLGTYPIFMRQSLGMNQVQGLESCWEKEGVAFQVGLCDLPAPAPAASPHCM